MTRVPLGARTRGEGRYMMGSMATFKPAPAPVPSTEACLRQVVTLRFRWRAFVAKWRCRRGHRDLCAAGWTLMWWLNDASPHAVSADGMIWCRLCDTQWGDAIQVHRSLTAWCRPGRPVDTSMRVA